MGYLDEIRAAFRQLHGCESAHVQTIPVKEVFLGQVAWEGAVEVFDLTGHPKAKLGYGWGYPNGKGGTEVVTVLDIPPVNSPVTAVSEVIRATLQAQGRSDPFAMMLEMTLHFPKKIAEIFAFKKKKDLLSYLSKTTITKDELARAIYAAQSGGFQHEQKHFEYVPESVETKVPQVGKLLSDKKIGSALSIIKSIFEQRRLANAHLFETGDKWHIFYFDQRDVMPAERHHWKHGPHIHFVNYLWANLTKEAVWDTLAGRSNKSYGTHVRFKDDEPSAPETEH